ncbi:hypothetical protein C2845_PM01G31700 [Panicum miliaceum]|uniref:F-box domain-containing protein n=1 Tax=Panicum miliaceum TaxID=4540 RepID=A0A3L6THS9_PANMI|nr:hypothetical protein C2845_PM01G31700 [Panicum miliaceum]
MDRSRPRAPVVAGLPDDLLLEVLSRVPFRSICRFKCVSRAWRDLISNPLHRCKLPQTLEGLFHEIHRRRHDRDGGGDNFRRHGCVGFVDLSGRSLPLVDPLFSFLRNLPAADSGDDGIRLMDTSHGLLLLDRGGYSLDSSPSYVVCNPATKQWLAVPDSDWTPSPCNGMSAYLIFSPAVSLHFSLVQFTNEVFTGVTSVQTYSSETGAWTHSEIAWSVEEKQAPCEGWRYQSFNLVPERKSTVINGMLYLICDSVGEGQVLDGDHIIAVDGEGKTRSFMPAPFQMHKEKCSILSDFVGQSQGLLHYVNHEEPEYYQNNDAPSEQYANGHTEGSEDDDVDYELFIWVLKVSDTQEFVLKHRVSFLHLFGEKSCQGGIDYSVAAIHPDRDVIFFTRDDELISYDMDTKEVRALHTVSDAYGFTSYVPCYSESPALTDKY